jgi:hypothetical protein
VVNTINHGFFFINRLCAWGIVGGVPSYLAALT